MKTWLNFFATIIVSLCVAGISILTATGHPVPSSLAMVALGALAGSFALLRLPTLGALVIAAITIAAMIALSTLSVVIPISLTEILIVAITGHFALSLPGPPAASVALSLPGPTATSVVVAPDPSTAASPPAASASTGATIGGL